MQELLLQGQFGEEKNAALHRSYIEPVRRRDMTPDLIHTYISLVEQTLNVLSKHRKPVTVPILSYEKSHIHSVQKTMHKLLNWNSED